MVSLHRRIAALEGPRLDPYAQLSDEEVKTRLVIVCEEIEALGYPMATGWRAAIAADDWREFERLAESAVPCVN